MTFLHLPKSHHTLPIHFGESIETVCEKRIRVASKPQAIAKRDARTCGDLMPCPDCTNKITDSITMGFYGEEIGPGSPAAVNLATA